MRSATGGEWGPDHHHFIRGLDMDIQRIGIVGCGLMGSGIAQCAAEAGLEVWVKEADESLLAKGLARIHGAWERAVAKGRLTGEQQTELGQRLHGTIAFAALAG